MELIEMLMQLVDLPAVVLSVGITQFVRWKMPSPEGGGKFDINPKLYRLLPLLPLVIATIVVIVKDGIFTPSMPLEDSIIKGLLSGMAAAYLYRTAKVMIFGDGNGKKIENKPPEIEEKKEEVIQ
jgi:hypothetical protein